MFEKQQPRGPLISDSAPWNEEEPPEEGVRPALRFQARLFGHGNNEQIPKHPEMMVY